MPNFIRMKLFLCLLCWKTYICTYIYQKEADFLFRMTKVVSINVESSLSLQDFSFVSKSVKQFISSRIQLGRLALLITNSLVMKDNRHQLQRFQTLANISHNNEINNTISSYVVKLQVYQVLVDGVRTFVKYLRKNITEA